MIMERKEKEIARLEEALKEASGIDEGKLAAEIKAIGFKCKRCAECCKTEYGDNTVTVFPFEIELIRETTGLSREDIVTTMPSEDTDSEGNIHTFEWVLRKNGDCVFLKSGLCRIYGCRPRICRTYPFYLLDGRLMNSECRGLGGEISSEESMGIAMLLKERYIAEIKESISLLGRFRGFKPGGRGNICVHDSEGEHWISSQSIL